MSNINLCNCEFLKVINFETSWCFEVVLNKCALKTAVLEKVTFTNGLILKGVQNTQFIYDVYARLSENLRR